MPQLEASSLTQSSGSPGNAVRLVPFTGQFDASVAQFPDGCRQVTEGEPDARSAGKVLPAREERAEDLDVPAIGELYGLQGRLGMHGRQARHVLMEVR
jgi:hypothetical protein